VIGLRLAESLVVSTPTVAATLKLMCRGRWVEINNNKEVSLTSRSRVMAMSLIRRHMLPEWMLLRVLKLQLSALHREAHQIEHSNS